MVSEFSLPIQSPVVSYERTVTVNSGSTCINRTAANEDDWTTGFPTDATEETISNFREMQTHLHVDEQDLRHMADSLIAKLQQIRDDEVEAALILADETV